MRRLVSLALIGTTTAALAADTSLTELGGRYTHRFKNGDVSGNVYYTTDVVEILPLDGSRAVVNFELNFFNGHSCSLSGITRLDGQRLVYREKEANPWRDGGCRLEIWRDRTQLRWAESEGTSCQSHCGARGGLSTGEISYRSRRKISPARANVMREDPEDLGER